MPLIVMERLGVRHVQAALLAGGLIINHMQQGSLGIAVVVMIKDQAQQMHMISKHRIFDWDKQTLSLITVSFFYSMIVSSFLAGYLTTKMDLKKLLLSCTAAGTLTAYATPILIYLFEWKAFLFVRLVMGAAQGFVKPVVYTMMVRWFPLDELMLIGPIILSGIYVGAGFMLVMGGYLGTGLGGWPSLFYFSGNCGLFWCIAFAGLGSSSPDSSFYISDLERSSINDSLPPSIRRCHRDSIPWKKIFTNVPLLAPTIAQAADNWAFQVFVKMTPIFYQYRLGYGLNITGLVSGLSYLMLSGFVYVMNFFFKYWRKRGKLNYTVMRHICNGIGQFGAFYCFLICSFSQNWYLSFILHYMGVIITALQLHGFYMNFIDLAPTYVGLVVGLCSGLAHITSILGPHFSIELYDSYGSDNEQWYLDKDFIAWRRVYDLISLNYFIGGTVFLFLGVVKEQSLNINESKC